MLQWGRDRSIAEFAVLARGLAFVDRASMGPRSIDRGIAPPAGFFGTSKAASMGPRSIDRGIASLRTWGERAELLLQWGRDRSIAELDSWICMDPDCTSLNG